MSVVFILSVMLLFIALVCFPGKENKRDLLLNISIALIIVMEIHAVCAYITLEVLKVNFSLIHYALFDMVCAIGIFCYRVLHRLMFKGAKIEKYEVQTRSLVVLIILFLCILPIGIWRFGGRLNLFAYCSSDSANHLAAVEKIIQSSSIEGLSGRYLFHINVALVIQAIRELVSPMSVYKIFLICELFFLFLSGIVFYGLLIKSSQCKNHWCTVLFVLLYVFGYPLNNMLYGYEYLGLSATIAVYILLLLQEITQKKERLLSGCLQLVLALFGLYHCYLLLFLPVFCGCIFILAFRMEKKFLGWKIVFFILIAVIGVWKLQELGIVWNEFYSKLFADATMYRDFWSNLLWFMPWTISGMYYGVKRYNTVLLKMLFSIILVMAVFFALMAEAKIGSYYYYKFYFLLWPVVLAVAHYGMSHMNNRVSKVFLCAMLMIIGIDQIKTSVGNQERTTNNIYFYNANILFNKISNMDMEKQELFYAAAEKVAQTGQVVPYIGTWELYLAEYYYALTNQPLIGNGEEQFRYIQYEYDLVEENVMQSIEENIYNRYETVPYIMVEKNSDAYWYGIGYYSTLEVEYENDYGILYKR